MNKRNKHVSIKLENMIQSNAYYFPFCIDTILLLPVHQYTDDIYTSVVCCCCCCCKLPHISCITYYDSEWHSRGPWEHLEKDCFQQVPKQTEQRSM